MSPDCSISTDGYGYVWCQIGLDQAMTINHPHAQTVRDRLSHCAAVCQASFHLCCWMKPHISTLYLLKHGLKNIRDFLTQTALSLRNKVFWII